MGRNLICENNIVDSVKKYNPNQVKLFYGMLYKFKEEVNLKNYDKEEDFEIYLSEIKEITKDSNLSQSRIYDLIDTMPNEIKGYSKNRMTRTAVFEYISYDFRDECLRFKVTGTFADIFLEVLDKYTIIQLKEISKLTGKYAVRLYELMRRYIGQEYYMMKMEDFTEYFQVPSSYKMCNIDYKILKPAIEELKGKNNIICDIKKNKKGRNITHITFRFRKGK